MKKLIKHKDYNTIEGIKEYLMLWVQKNVPTLFL